MQGFFLLKRSKFFAAALKIEFFWSDKCVTDQNGAAESDNGMLNSTSFIDHLKMTTTSLRFAGKFVKT